MIFNTINPIIKKDAEWIPLQSGVSTYAPDPSNWTNYGIDFEKPPEFIALRVEYGGAYSIGILERNRYGYDLIYNQADVIEDAVLVTPVNTVNNLPSGSKVQLGRYLKESDSTYHDFIWTVARDTALDNTLRLVLSPESVKIYWKVSGLGDKWEYDAKEPSNPDTKARNYGNSDYTLSNVRQWLNSEKKYSEWYTPSHSYDAAPAYANRDNGFLYAWNGYELDYLRYMTLSAVQLDGSIKTFTDKVALMSRSEFYGTVDRTTIGNNNGSAGTLDIFPDHNSRILLSPGESVSTGYYQLTRDVDIWADSTNSFGSIFGILSTNGTGEHDNPSRSNAFRPMIETKSNMPVSAEPDDAGYYQVKLDGAFHISFSTISPAAWYLPIYDPE